MVFVLSVAAAIFLGVGWVVQQRVATHSQSGGLLSWTVVKELIGSGLWWLGIVAMTLGQTLSSVALQFGTVSTVEPVLVASLLVAFVISAASGDQRPRWQEMAGPGILIVALVVFLTVASPRQAKQPDPSWQAILIATAAAGVLALLVAGSGKLLASRTAPVVECTLLAVGAGIMYGLQDAATRGAIVFTHHHRVIAVVPTMWPWVLLASATAGVLLTQASFRAGRLDWALPPTAASQPIAGIVLGVVLLGDHLAATGLALAFESLSLVAMLGGVLLIGQSRAFGTVGGSPLTVVSFDALVLAGGAGQRMGDPRGTDKARLDVGGITLLDRVLAAVPDAQRCIVVGPRRPTARPVTFTIEDPPGSGPAAAIVHGLSLVNAAIVVVLATDMPFAATAVPKLTGALDGVEADAAMLVDESGRRQPLLAAYRTDVLRRRSDGRDWRGASVHALTEGLTVIEVGAVGDEALDCDTPEQLTAAQKAANVPPAG